MLEESFPTVEEILKNRPVTYLATIDADQPRVRPVTLIEDQGDLFILTGTKNAKIVQIRKHGKVEAVIPVKYGETTGYVRFTANAAIEERPNYRERAAKAAPFFNEYYDSPDDPRFTLLRLEPKRIEYLKPGQMYPEEVTQLKL